MLMCTICTGGYLPKAAVLATSFRQAHPSSGTVLCLVERDRSALANVDGIFTTVVLAAELGIPNFEQFVFQYTQFEACMAVKAKILLWALSKFPEEQDFVYLDSDICVYSRFSEVEQILPVSPIVLTPHHLICEEASLKYIPEYYIRTLMCGVFNSGFLAVRRNQMSLAFLEWWDHRLLNLCYKDTSVGLYYEQRWLELAHGFFDVTVLREVGYNVANWNIAGRSIVATLDAVGYLVNGCPLRFFHFSMIDTGRDLYYFKHYLAPDSTVFTIRRRYIVEVASFERGDSSRRSWTYSCFSSGEPISTETRYRYRNYPGIRGLISDPFDYSNGTIAATQASLLRTVGNTS